MRRAEVALAVDDYAAAVEALSRGMETHPKSTEVRASKATVRRTCVDAEETDRIRALLHNEKQIADALGSLLAEMGENERAVEVFQKAVQVSPDHGFEKYLYLGQMLVGNESLECMRKGIDVLERELLMANGPQQEELQTELCRAVCALAESTLNHAEEPASVQEEVMQLLEKAASLDETCPEPLQVMASLYIEVDKPNEARDCLKKSMSLWFSFEQPDVSQKEDKHAQEDPVEDTPPYEFRFETAKLLLELGEFETAGEVLGGLLEEADSSLDVWYLFAISQHSLGDHEDAKESVQTAAKLMKGMTPEDDYVLMFAELHESIELAIAQESKGENK